jgi:hypothetical protein
MKRRTRRRNDSRATVHAETIDFAGDVVLAVEGGGPVRVLLLCLEGRHRCTPPSGLRFG